MRPFSFRTRLTLLSTAGIALVLVIASVTIYLLVRDQLRDEVDSTLLDQSSRAFIASRGRVQLGSPPEELGSTPVYVNLIDRVGNRVFRGREGVSLPAPQRVIDVARGRSGAYFTDVSLRGAHLRMYVAPKQNGLALLVARSLSEVDRALDRLIWTLGLTCLAGIALAAFVGAGVARSALRPIQKLTDAAERIRGTRNLGERIDTRGDDELSRLGQTFNSMLDSLEEAIRSQRRLVADASHELRTPLTSVRTNIELLRQGAPLSDRDRERLLRDLTNEIEGLATLVANLVDRARGTQRDLHLEPVRLDVVTQGVLRRAEAQFPRVDFELAAEETAVWGDADELACAVWNLVENAAKWSGDGDQVEVSVADGEVVVRDHGPGVPAGDQPYVFDRFYRSEAARSKPGSGLGMAIVREIAESHGGRVDLEDAPGGGARFRLSLVETPAVSA